MNTTNNKMQVEIWSDVMCPFCYIGKRKFENALDTFEGKDSIEIVWKSFQLSPNIKTEPGKNINQYLAEHKGVTLEHAQVMNDRVTQMAAQVGLTYNMDKAVVANSFNAHRFSHFAKQYGKQNEAEEQLFKAYFTDGKNTDDAAVLLELGTLIGLDTAALQNALESNAFADEVQADIYEAQQVGANGVPFFVFNNKYALSGAMESRVFTQALEQSFTDWKSSR